MLSYIPPFMYSVCAPSYLVILINPFPIMSPRACPRALLLVFGPKVPLLLVYAHLLTTHLLSEIDNLYQLICSLLVTLVRQRDPSPSVPSHTCTYRAWELFPRKMENSGLFMICHPQTGKVSMTAYPGKISAQSTQL